MRIHLSEATKNLLDNSQYVIEERGLMDIKVRTEFNFYHQRFRKICPIIIVPWAVRIYYNDFAFSVVW